MPRPRRPAGAALLLIVMASVAALGLATRPGRAQNEVASRAVVNATVAGAQDVPPSQARSWRIVARKYSYSEPRIEVQQDDLVKITLETSDIPHSFTIDEPYRIAKRATPGHPVVFEFRADKAGTFEFYCNLKTDDGCRNMKGQLIVKARR